jgi:DNA polymerase-3 subunit alpha
MSKFAVLHSHTMFSLLRGVSKPKEIAKRCADMGYGAAAMTDFGNIGCSVKFISAFEKTGIKPILGTELFMCEQPASVRTPDNHTYSNLIIQSKNLKGWSQLVKLTSFASNKDNLVMGVPRADLDGLAPFADGNLLAISGYPGSQLANALFEHPEAAYAATDLQKAVDVLHPDRIKRIMRLAERHIEIFGKENFFLGIQRSGAGESPAHTIIAENMRWLAKKLGIKRVATTNSYYPTPDRDKDHRVLIATALKSTLRFLDNTKGTFDPEEKLYKVLLKTFFRSSDYSIPCLADLESVHDEEEIRNTTLVADMCESYDIRRQPIFPTFDCPDGMSMDDYLSHLCRQSWNAKIKSKVDPDKLPEYVDRIKRELEVIKGATLSGYFLVVQDYVNWAKRQGMLVGPGRGSGAGCLTSYLLGITNVDPILYDLRFERFYNAGRNQPGKISLPDIDCDFPVLTRKLVIEYLKTKCGTDMVAQIATFNSMKGRGALTDVLRAYGVDFAEVKKITSAIPEEARISEELQAMKESGIEPSIIRYALESDAESFKEWCEFTPGQPCGGTFGPYFDMAMRLEGTKRNISTHAAAVVLASTPLSEMCPLMYEDSIDGYVACMEYPDLEAMGQVKLDILGVAALDKVAGVRNLLRYGRIEV